MYNQYIIEGHEKDRDTLYYISEYKTARIHNIEWVLNPFNIDTCRFYTVEDAKKFLKENKKQLFRIDEGLKIDPDSIAICKLGIIERLYNP